MAEKRDGDITKSNFTVYLFFGDSVFFLRSLIYKLSYPIKLTKENDRQGLLVSNIEYII